MPGNICVNSLHTIQSQKQLKGISIVGKKKRGIFHETFKARYSTENVLRSFNDNCHFLSHNRLCLLFPRPGSVVTCFHA